MSFHKSCFEQSNSDWKEFLRVVEEESIFNALPTKIGNTKQLRNWIDGFGGIENAKQNVESGEWKFVKKKSTWYVL